MADFATGSMLNFKVLLKISEKFRNNQLCVARRKTEWTCSKNLARHKFIPGSLNGSSLKGNCSMLKVVRNENLGTLTIFGRTDLVNCNGKYVSHANWRRELSLPIQELPNKFKCYQEKDYVVVDLDLSKEYLGESAL